MNPSLFVVRAIIALRCQCSDIVVFNLNLTNSLIINQYSWRQSHYREVPPWAGCSWIKPNIYRFNRWRWQHCSEKFRMLFSKANSNYCNAKNREMWPQGLDLGGSTASNWRFSITVDPEAVFLDFDLSKLSNYQFVYFVSGYFSAQQTAFVCRKFQK